MCFIVARADDAGMHAAWAAVALTVVLWASAFAAIRAALEGFTRGRAVGAAARGRVASRWPRRRRSWACAARRRATCRRSSPPARSGMTAYQLLLNAGERTVPRAPRACS